MKKKNNTNRITFSLLSNNPRRLQGDPERYAIVSPFTITCGAVKNTDYVQRHQSNHPTDVFRRLIVVVLVKLKNMQQFYQRHNCHFREGGDMQ